MSDYFKCNKIIEACCSNDTPLHHHTANIIF